MGHLDIMRLKLKQLGICLGQQLITVSGQSGLLIKEKRKNYVKK